MGRGGEVWVDESVSEVVIAIDVSLEKALIPYMIYTCLLICLINRMAESVFIIRRVNPLVGLYIN
jgi:sorbitol-specific phosphotransferase system component IIBC